MGRLYDAIDDSLRVWIERQPVFFVATAPSGDGGHINLSPKGAAGTFRVLGSGTVAYVDLFGSGIETVAHLQENGRIVLMFCAFAGPPKIVRLHGRGRVVLPGDEAFSALFEGFVPSDEVRGAVRGVVEVEVERISDSCGFVVPRMEFVGERDQLYRWAEQKRAKNGAGWQEGYAREKNRTSIDGLAGLDLAMVGATAGTD